MNKNKNLGIDDFVYPYVRYGEKIPLQALNVHFGYLKILKNCNLEINY